MAILEVFLFVSQIQQGRLLLFPSGGYSLTYFLFFESMGNGYNMTFLFHTTLNSIDMQTLRFFFPLSHYDFVTVALSVRIM